jgi:hypothetical protein
MRLINRLLRITASALLLMPTVSYIFLTQTVYAAAITPRTLTISSSKVNDTNVTYNFNFKVPSATALKSLAFTPCMTASGACTIPSGFSRSGYSLTSQPTNLGSGTWTIDTTTIAPAPAINAGSLLITNAGNSTAQVPADLINVSFSGVHNPDIANGTTFFLRIQTYSDSSYTTAVDSGTTAAATVLQITLTGTMPESLIFCVGATIGTISNVPDCTTATTGAVNFNQLFSPTDTAYATSQMAASTNAASGYVITVSGTTLTSGGNTILAMGATDVSKHGFSQFGMNLVANTGMDPVGGVIAYTSYGAFGSNLSLPSSTGPTYKGQAIPGSGYDQPDYFRYDPATPLANSANLGAGPSDGQIYTASYIVNVTGSQPAGSYTSTLTYVCTPTF